MKRDERSGNYLDIVDMNTQNDAAAENDDFNDTEIFENTGHNK